MNRNNNQDKKKIAVALAYNPQEIAPKIVAAGKGKLAEKIINKAVETNVPIHKDEALADTLSGLELGSYIPPELYDVVAEILAFIARMDNIKEEGNF